jgi:DNA-binding CsgD family transcriptional regulator
MIRLLVYTVFIFSAAFASTGFLLSLRLRNRFKSGYLSSLLYYQVFIFTFGFYGIWGQVLIRSFLSDLVTTSLLTRFTDIALLLGLPFLVFAWLMLIRFSREISGWKNRNSLLLWFLPVNFLTIAAIGYFISKKSDIGPAVLFKYYFIAFNLFYTLLSVLAMLFPGRNRSFLYRTEARIAAFFLLIITAIQSVTLFLYSNETVTGLIFIFSFFAGNAFLPVYLSYGIKLSVFSEEPFRNTNFEDFCKKYEVSPRESDIIREICNGLSNKEISEKLFISLQTVKDHTHRIYIKINVRSRSQLMNLVKEIKGI